MAEEAKLIREESKEEQQGDQKQTEDMELESEVPSAAAESENGVAVKENGTGKRHREADETTEEEQSDVTAPKKQKADQEKSVEEERVETLEHKEIGEEKEKEENDKSQEPVKLGPKTFSSSIDMFNYIYNIMHYWSPNVDLNKYEHMVLLDLLMKGHSEPDKKIGDGVQAFQIRNHPLWKSRCYFIVRADGSSEDFSFRKCVHNIIPLPDNIMAPAKGNGVNGNRNGGAHYSGRGGRGGGRGGRGGRGRR